MITSLPLVLMILLLGFPQIGETIYTPSLPDIARDLAASDFLTELTLGIFFAGFALGVLFWGVAADRKGRRKAMLWGLCLYIFASLGCCLSPSIEFLLVFRFFQAFGASVGSVVSQTMLRDVYSGEDRSRVFSLIGGALSFSPAIGPLLGGFLDQYFGWHANFAALLGMGIVLGTFSYFLLPETKSAVFKRVPTFEVAKRVYTDPHVLCYAFLVGAGNGVLFSYYAEAPFIFIDQLAYTPAQYGWLGIPIASSMILAAWISNRLNKRMESNRVVFIGCLWMGLGALLLAGSSLGGLVNANYGVYASLAFVLPVFVMFLGFGMMIPNCLSHALTHYREVVGTAGSLFGLLYYIYIAIFTSLIGLLHNGTAVPLSLYALTLTAAMLMTLYVREKISVKALRVDS